LGKFPKVYKTPELLKSMAKIFVSKRVGKRRWEPLEDTYIARFLGDPVMTGEVILHNPEEPILEEITDSQSHEQFSAFMDGVHIATNYGLSTFFIPGTTHIAPPKTKNKGYSLIQFTDMVVDYDRFQSKSTRPNLTANSMKMSGAGRNYRIDGTFEEVMAELKAHYKFIGPEENEMMLNWFMRSRSEVQNQREGKITKEFVDYANQDYYSEFYPKHPATKKDLVEHFSGNLCL